MKKKSVAIIVWVISAVIAVAVGIVALSQECVHTWTESVTVEATCTKEGEKTLVCSRCREIKTEKIAKLDHKFSSWKTTKEATCDSSGIQTRQCSVCKEKETKTISALGHDYRELTSERIEATCISDGTKFFQCSRCSVTKQETIRKVGHSFTEWVEPNPNATCKDASHNGYHKCKYCGIPNPTEYEESIIEPAHLTEEGWVVVSSATCVKQGKAVQTCQHQGCDKFGTEYTVNLPMLEHSYVTVEAKAATCMEAGYNQHEQCEYCGGTKGYIVAEKLPHQFNDDGYCTLKYDCGTYTYIFTQNADGESYTLTGINQDSVSEKRTEFNIPGIYNDKPVTAIGDGVFNGFNYVKNITISENITSIGKSAFKNCVNLESVTVRVGEARTNPVSNVVKVGEYAFEGCAKLNGFDFSSLVEIGESAFYGTAFEEIVLTDKVTSIGARAFGSTTKLEAITVPFVGLTKTAPDTFGKIFGLTNYDVSKTLKSVTVLYATKLVAGAFESVGSLTSVALPVDCVEFGASAFEDCTVLTEICVGTVSENFAPLNNFSKATALGADMLKGTSLGSVVLPFLGNGKNITNLGYLYGGENTMVSSSLISVELPTVTLLQSDAFSACANIVTVKFGSLKTVMSDAFNGCTKLKNVVTDDVNTTGVYLNTNVTSIGLGAFTGCTSIESFTVPFLGESIEATSEDHRNLGYFFGASVNSRLNGIEELALKTVVVLQANTDTVLDSEAFAGFVSLQSVTIPAVSEIGEKAFSGCVALEGVYYGPNAVANDFVQVTEDGENVEIKTVNEIGFAAFEDCFKTNRSEFTMVVPFIGETGAYGDYNGDDKARNPYSFGYIFGGVENASEMMTGVEVKSVVSPFKVSPYAFKDFAYLKTIVLPESLTEIGAYAFDGCEELNDFSFLENSEKLDKICKGAFRNCSSLTSIVIPDSVTCIEIAAFEGCDSLGTMTLPFAGRSNNYLEEGLEASQRAFGYIFNTSASTSLQVNFVPRSLKRVVLTKATSIVGQAFYGCKYIEYVTLPATVTEIGTEAFKDCSALKEVIFDGVEKENAGVWTVSEIAAQTFYNCTSLQTVVLPQSVKAIGDSAFRECSALRNIKTALEEDSVLSVEKIDADAFVGSFDSFSKVNLTLKNLQEVGSYAFSSTKFYSVVFDDVTCVNVRMGDVVFSASKVYSVVLPDSFTRIEISTFEACSNLRNFIMPASIRYIGNYAFKNCTNLTIVATHADFEGENAVVFDHAVEIGNNAFENCTSLKEVVFNNYEEHDSDNYISTKIGEKAFYGCSGITRVYLKEFDATIGEKIHTVAGVGEIGAYAFFGCGSFGRYVNICIEAEKLDYESNTGWDKLWCQGANVDDQNTPFVSDVSYDDYRDYRDYCKDQGGYASWNDYQAYLKNQNAGA